MSGLATLISIFRFAVGVHGSGIGWFLTGVTWLASGAPPLRVIGIAEEAASDFIGDDRLRSLQMFSCDEDKLIQPWSQSCDNLGLIENETHFIIIYTY